MLECISCILPLIPSKLIVPIQATYDNKHKNQLTMPVIMQIHQLISPLRKDPQRILQESNDNEEAADGRQVRLDRLAERVQPVLDLARLLADGVERRRVVGRVAARRPGVEARVLALEVIAGGATDGHGGRIWWWWRLLLWWCRRKGKEGVIAAALQRGRKSWKRERACVCAREKDGFARAKEALIPTREREPGACGDPKLPHRYFFFPFTSILRPLLCTALYLSLYRSMSLPRL